MGVRLGDIVHRPAIPSRTVIWKGIIGSIEFGQSPEFWLNLQKSWELSQIDVASFKKLKKIKKIVAG